MDEEGIEVQDMFDPSTMAAMLRIALNNLVQDVDPNSLPNNPEQDDGMQSSQPTSNTLNEITKGETLGSGNARSTKLKGGMTTCLLYTSPSPRD